MKKNQLLLRVGLLLSCVGMIIGSGLEACAPPPSGGGGSVTIGGEVIGLDGDLVLQNNGTDDLALDSEGEFQFNDDVEEGSEYVVTVLTQPTGQNCVVADGSGTADTDVTDILVTCTNTAQYTVGGMVEGLVEGQATFVLQNNGTDDLTIVENGSFTFSTPLLDGASYLVSIFTNAPFPYGPCEILSGGEGTVSGANVTNVEISCGP